MSLLRLLFQVLPFAALLTACAVAPTVIDPHHDPANAAAPEGPMSKSSASLMEKAPQVDLEEQNSSGNASDEGMKSMPGMKGMSGMGGMKDMPGMSSSPTSTPKTSNKTIYTCPMHPEIRQDHPGKCPKCGMTLVPQKSGATP